MPERYAVIAGSESSHCCFEATVVDTYRPVMMGDKHYQRSDGRYCYESVCECFDLDTAQAICAALNAHIREDD